ncbi:hypothetical protein D3C75_1110900 [compost metagenome]
MGILAEPTLDLFQGIFSLRSVISKKIANHLGVFVKRRLPAVPVAPPTLGIVAGVRTDIRQFNPGMLIDMIEKYLYPPHVKV